MTPLLWCFFRRQSLFIIGNCICTYILIRGPLNGTDKDARVRSYFLRELTSYSRKFWKIGNFAVSFQFCDFKEVTPVYQIIVQHVVVSCAARLFDRLEYLIVGRSQQCSGYHILLFDFGLCSPKRPIFT